MSYKQELIKMLKKNIKSPESVLINSPKRTRCSPIAIKEKLFKKRRRKRLKHQVVTHYSDSDIEFNISSPSDITPSTSEHSSPSKSDHSREILPESPSVDTVYHIYNTYDNNALPPFEDKSNDEHESHDADDGLIVPHHTLKNKEVKRKSYVNYYNINNGRVILIKHKSRVYLHGSFNLTLIHGNINILGYHLSTSSNELDIHSLRGFSYLYLENIHQANCPAPDDIRNKLSKIGVSKSDISEIFSKCKFEDAIVFCSKIDSRLLAYVDKHISQKILPSFGEHSPAIVRHNNDDVNLLKSSSDWNDICKLVHNNTRLMICGGKGVGKSTLLKYMINKLLMTFHKVLVIDLDPGQAEFTLPGCVSAVIVEKPIFGPSFTHLQQPERCIAVGNIDVSLEPDVYIKSVIELLRQCKDYKEIPTLVNYMGYTQNYGINIASTVISFVRPTILLQINSTQSTKNFEKNLTPDMVSLYSSMFGMADASKLVYEFILIKSMSDGSSSWKAQGRTTREMSIISYFSKVVDDTLSLTSKNVPLHKILLKDITLVCNNSKRETNKLAIFNASLVSLCTSTIEAGIYNCHGWGIVRGIDEESLVLITPVDENTLERVTHLLVGSVALPASLLMYEDNNLGLVPYVSLAGKTKFNYFPKRSYLPKKTN